MAHSAEKDQVATYVVEGAESSFFKNLVRSQFRSTSPHLRTMSENYLPIRTYRRENSLQNLTHENVFSLSCKIGEMSFIIYLRVVSNFNSNRGYCHYVFLMSNSSKIFLGGVK